MYKFCLEDTVIKGEGAKASQLTPLFVFGWGRLQLIVAQCGISVALLKVFDN